MISDGRALSVTLVAALFVATAALVPALSAGAVANEIPVMSATQSQATSLSDPTASAWTDASTETVPLSSAPSGAPRADETSIDRLNVEAAQADGRLYVRLSWRDATMDGNISPSADDAQGLNSFGDAVAVQFPVNASTQPGIAMGGPNAMVNLWWWNGEMGSQELLAGGPGTTTQFEEMSVETSATYRDGRWYVVFVRDLAADGNRATLDVNQDVNVAFAVWNGSNAERAGRKAVSEWYHFPFGPEPGGPPFETVLWTIAGIAIAVVLAVTAQAVRRGG